MKILRYSAITVLIIITLIIFAILFAIATFFEIIFFPFRKKENREYIYDYYD